MSNTEDHSERNYLEFDNIETAMAYFDSKTNPSPVIGSKITPLLPVSSDFISLIGFDCSVPSLIIQFCKSRNERLPISRATLFKLPKFATGAVIISRKILMKTVHFMWKLTNHKFKLIVPIQSTGGTAETWDGLIQSIRQWNVPNTEWRLLLQFIEERINLEHKLLVQLKAFSGHRSMQTALYLETLRNHSLLPDQVLELLPLFLLSQQPAELTHTQFATLKCSLKLDFYFSVIACLELGWLQKLSQELPEIQKHKTDWFVNGVVQQFIKPLIFEGNSIELKTPFEFYLDWLATDIGSSANSTNISQAQLASFIPIERTEDTAGGYTLTEKQKDLLKDWKKSNYPSPSKFYEFIKNLRGGLTDDALFLIDIGFAAIALDKLFITLFEQLRSHSSTATYQAMDSCICRYREYFQHYRDQKIAE